MAGHANDCKAARHALMALRETVPGKQFIDKLLNAERELCHLRPPLARNLARNLARTSIEGCYDAESAGL